MNRRNIRFQYFRNRYARQRVFVIPSKSYGQVFLILEPDGIKLTNNYGGKMPGFLEIGLFWSRWWKHGIRWCWINKPEPQEV